MHVNLPLFGLAFLWGTFLGLIYFGGLWLTVKTAPGKQRPVRWLAASFLARIAVALAGFWVALRMNPAALFLALAGFFLVRIVLTRVLGRKRKGIGHAAHA
ncbi:ATP synthase subunit I [uncultured Desulfosarcina sp.]|uniref:ATP synthase subunit I n=1 Tax=uncultured Desulfosarcina sp. TaxID=218289 RepID=UPI0029C82A95|nr:ATP synthase subunit I [uncultured Desulfosarcina sp.]